MPLPLDVADFHTYAVDWMADKADFLVDGVQVRTCLRPPGYPMQLMLAVFDFPEVGRYGRRAHSRAHRGLRAGIPALTLPRLAMDAPSGRHS